MDSSTSAARHPSDRPGRARRSRPANRGGRAGPRPHASLRGGGDAAGESRGRHQRPHRARIARRRSARREAGRARSWTCCSPRGAQQWEGRRSSPLRCPASSDPRRDRFASGSQITPPRLRKVQPHRVDLRIEQFCNPQRQSPFNAAVLTSKRHKDIKTLPSGHRVKLLFPTSVSSHHA